jgi:hypothetical protein
MEPFLKNTQHEKSWGVSQAVESLPSKREALSTNPSAAKKNSVYSAQKNDLCLTWEGTEQLRLHHSSQNSMELETCRLLISGIFHSVFSDYGQLWITESKKAMDLGGRCSTELQMCYSVLLLICWVGLCVPLAQLGRFHVVILINSF